MVSTPRPYHIRSLEETDNDRDWDVFVSVSCKSSAFELSGWRRILSDSYGLRTHFLYQEDEDGVIVATLPLAVTGNFLLGYTLTSLPYLDYAGVTAAPDVDCRPLLNAARQLAAQRRYKRLEIRNSQPLLALADERGHACTRSTAKVRPVKAVSHSPNELLQSFKAKLRSQIKRPLKDGLTFKSGSLELLGDFYRVFLANMRDLGSPAHGFAYFKSIFSVLNKNARVFVVYWNTDPLAAGILLYTSHLAENPWSSSLRKAARMSPNMLLYWAMLEFCAEHRISHFSFGRSSEGSGTYRFKQQWGVENQPLYWHRLLGPDSHPGGGGRSRIAAMAVNAWKHLPITATRFVGPPIRRHISL